VTGSSDEIESLRQELDAINKEIWSVYYDLTIGRPWLFAVGPVRLYRRFGSQRLGQFYAVFCLLGFAAGAGLTFINTTKEIGIGLMIGSIFAFGSIMAQFWAVTVQHEQAARWHVFGPDTEQELRELRGRRDSLHARLVERLERVVSTEDDDDPGS
jgi:hypothetical protein